MKEHRKFIALAILVFLVFVALGKYSQSTALASADVLYTTEVKDKRTGEIVKFEIQRTKDNRYRVKNTKTNQTYVTKAKHAKGNYVNITLPGDQGDIVIRKGLNPLSQPTVRVENSQKYVQLEQSSTSRASSADASESSSSSSSQTDASSKSPQKLSLTAEQEQDIMSDFGDWLYDSDYAKDAVLVQGKAYDTLMASSGIVFWDMKTSDGSSILARLIGYYKGPLEDLKDDKMIYVDGENASLDELLQQRDGYKLTMLGNDLSSDQAEDYQSNAAFRLYTLKDPQHKHFKQTTDEEDFLDNFDIPDSEKNMAKNMGYDYYYDHEVDHSKDSYQIILATDGKVYYTKDYWYDNSQSIDQYVYQEAPEDMQKAYSDLLEKYSADSSSTTSTSKDDSPIPQELLGSWKGKDGADNEVTITYSSDGSVKKEVKGANGSITTAEVDKVEKVADQLYRFAQGEDLNNAISLTTGVGGVGVRYEFGYRLTDDKHLTYVCWGGAADTEFDTSTYKEVGKETVVFTKQD